MNMISKKITLILLSSLTYFFTGCRQDYVPTDDELADYGWVLFSQKNYIGARDWFKQAVEKDSSYMDGYCGLGWSNGKMGYADTAYNYLFQGKDLNYDDVRFPNQVNLPIDIIAGLVFASRAMGNDALTITYSQEFDFKQNQIQVALGDGSYRWKLKEFLFNSLEYNSKIDAQDVRLAWSTAQYNTGNFSDCVSNMRIIWEDAGVDTIFEPDILTVEGRDQIAKELEALQIKLSK
tara:strand:- start:744 stop:1448 length:705 start_codon:yes stop_codon:yes gene_type:complete